MAQAAATANSRLNLREAFAWPIAKIISDYLNPIEQNARAWLDPRQTLSHGPLPHMEQLVAIVSKGIVYRLEQKIILRKAGVSEDPVTDPMHGLDEGTKDLRNFFHETDSVGIDLPFLGIPVSAVTTYDLLGWLLSVTTNPPIVAAAAPKAATKTPPPPGIAAAPKAEIVDYYVPLLALYAKWVITVSDHCVDDRPPSVKSVRNQNMNVQPKMVSIAWFDLSQSGGYNGPFKGNVVILGCTIGNPANADEIILTDRRLEMKSLYVPDKPQALLDQASAGPAATVPAAAAKAPAAAAKAPAAAAKAPAAAEKARSSFGRCAETAFWIFARRAGMQRLEECAKGIALRPDDFRTITAYDPANFKAKLADPCSSCQCIWEQFVKNMYFPTNNIPAPPGVALETHGPCESWKLGFSVAPVQALLT